MFSDDPVAMFAARVRHPSTNVDDEIMRFRDKYVVDSRSDRDMELSAIASFQADMRAEKKCLEDALAEVFSLTDREDIHEVITEAFLAMARVGDCDDASLG